MPDSLIQSWKIHKINFPNFEECFHIFTNDGDHSEAPNHKRIQGYVEVDMFVSRHTSFIICWK